MTSLSSGPSTDQLRTISIGNTLPSSSSSELSSVTILVDDGNNNLASDIHPKLNTIGDKKRPRDSLMSNGSDPKKVKVGGDEEVKEKGIYCHQ